MSTSVSERVKDINETEELHKRGYSIGCTLGEGSYGKVKRAVCAKRNRTVAVKIISKKKIPKDVQNKFLPRELLILRKLNHPNIINLFEIMNVESRASIIFFMLQKCLQKDLNNFSGKIRTEKQDRSKNPCSCSLLICSGISL